MGLRNRLNTKRGAQPRGGTVDLVVVFDRSTDRVRLTVASGETTSAELLRILQMLRDEVVAQTAVELYRQSVPGSTDLQPQNASDQRAQDSRPGASLRCVRPEQSGARH